MSVILTLLLTFKVYSISMQYTGNTDFLKYVILKKLKVSALPLQMCLYGEKESTIVNTRGFLCYIYQNQKTKPQISINTFKSPFHMSS